MSLKTLKSLHGKANENDFETINFLYQNRGQDLSDALDNLITYLSRDQIEQRYFRQSSRLRVKGATTGTNFNYFVLLGGVITVNKYRQDELKWVLGA
ncbi:hypothetical protein NX722_08435 [Endozoicomonas gorgoniicola]|uniref:Cyclic nucleotide-binding domain-containing protein n=1 Tax=Endozoicomonas gorgoniicola TaxID=1234144 RepID=A0ABT3MTH3_9GAMM|nr:hypothetical protein [Endozoicomonas gorgoniicola]MCW7552670.1 hypothetical protein [Endozoicomonas gorgoniicola]